MSPPTATYIGSSRRRYGDAHGCRWGVPVVIAQPNHRRRNGRPVPLTVDPMPCSCMRSITLIGIQTGRTSRLSEALATPQSSSLSPVLSLHAPYETLSRCIDRYLRPTPLYVSCISVAPESCIGSSRHSDRGCIMYVAGCEDRISRGD